MRVLINFKHSEVNFSCYYHIILEGKLSSSFVKKCRYHQNSKILAA